MHKAEYKTEDSPFQFYLQDRSVLPWGPVLN